MQNNNQTAQAIKAVFANLSGEDRNVIGVVNDLFRLAITIKRLECYADRAAEVHVIVDGAEAFACRLQDDLGNFRNLLAVMYGFAKQFAQRNLSPELSPYKIDCILNLAEFADEEDAYLRLETVNTASEQRFVLSHL